MTGLLIILGIIATIIISVFAGSDAWWILFAGAFLFIILPALIKRKNLRKKGCAFHPDDAI